TGGSASALSLSRPAQALLALQPAESLDRPRRPLSRGFSPDTAQQSCSSATGLIRQLSGWNPPPLVIRAVRAHCQNQTFKLYGPQSAGRLRKKASAILTKKIRMPTAKT